MPTRNIWYNRHAEKQKAQMIYTVITNSPKLHTKSLRVGTYNSGCIKLSNTFKRCKKCMKLKFTLFISGKTWKNVY